MRIEGSRHAFDPSRAKTARDQLDIVLARFPTPTEAGGNVPAILLDSAREAVRRAHDLDWATMMLEVLAEAARNPAVSAIVRAADAEVAARVRELIVSGFTPGCVPDDIDQRMEMMGLAIESATFRRVSHPEMPPAVIDRLLELITVAIFAPSSDKSAAAAG